MTSRQPLLLVVWDSYGHNIFNRSKLLLFLATPRIIIVVHCINTLFVPDVHHSNTLITSSLHPPRPPQSHSSINATPLLPDSSYLRFPMGCLHVMYFICFAGGSLLVAVGVIMNYVARGLGPLLLAAVGGVLIIVGVFVATIAAACAKKKKRSSSFDSLYASHVIPDPFSSR